MIKVFPSQTVSRSYLASDCMKTPNVAILTKNYISWDTFKNTCREIPKDKTKATFAQRLIFAKKILKEDETKKNLVYYRTKFNESRNAFALQIANNIEKYKNALKYSEKINKDLAHDMTILCKLYQQYLEQNKLYEEEYIEPDFSKAEKDTLIYFASTIEDPLVDKALKAGIKNIENQIEDSVVKVYPSTLAEIRQTFREVREILKKGEKASNIAISCASLKTNLPYIEEEAKRYNIKINIAMGKKLSEYPSGKFFIQLKNIYDNTFSFDSVKKLLDNPSFELTSPAIRESIIKNAIELKVKDGKRNAATWINKFKKKGLEQEATYISDLATLIRESVNADNVQHLKLSLRRLQDNFLEGKSWDTTNRQTDILAFQRCMEITTCLEGVEKPYNTFVEIIKNTTYAPQNAEFYVNVYPYPLSCGLSVKHHYIIGLDEKSCAVEKCFVKSTDAENRNTVTNQILSAYPSGSTYYTFSSAEETYSGKTNLPFFFAPSQKHTKVTEPAKDSFVQEAENWEQCKNDGLECTEFQTKEFEKAINTTLCTSTAQLKKVPNEIIITATSLSTYLKCPYQWMLKSVCNINYCDFEPLMEDNYQIGNLLHKTYETYLNETKQFVLDSEQLKKTFKEEIEKLKTKAESTDEISINAIISRYEDKLDSLFTNAPEELIGASLEQIEQQFCYSLDGLTYKGSIDCVLKTNDGSYCLLDFKKGKADKNTLQLVFYAKAFEYQTGCVVKHASYYSVGEQKYTKQWSKEEERVEYLKELNKILKNAKTDIESGNYTYAKDAKDCENCEYRRICRKRYVIK